MLYLLNPYFIRNSLFGTGLQFIFMNEIEFLSVFSYYFIYLLYTYVLWFFVLSSIYLMYIFSQTE
jgi:hypothetical protein